jgi:hypothetical protein
VKMVPAPVLADCRLRAEELASRARLGRRGWMALATLWLALAALSAALAYRP